MLRFIFNSLLALFLLGVVAVGGVLWYIIPGLPSIETLKDVHLQTPLRVYSHDGKLMSEFGEKRRTPLTFKQIPKVMIHAVLSAEDDRFYEHPGVDWQGILRAAIELIRTGQKTQGGSTITMQVARNFFLTRQKTYLRKANEILLALKIERELTKNEILDLYLNKIYLGQRAYGVAAAAQVYYGKPLKDLSLAQIAMIAGLPKAPSTANPIADPPRSIERRNYVLGRMFKLGYINQQAYDKAVSSPVTASLHGLAIQVHAPYVAEMVRTYMVEKYGEDVYNSGYKVYTTINAHLQQAANHALRTALENYDERHGYRGPERHYDLNANAGEDVWNQLLDGFMDVGNLKPALVVRVEDKSAVVYNENLGLVTVDWSGLSWARPYINVDARGPKPKTAGDILKVGDVIRIRKTADGWRLAEVPAVEGALVSLDPNDGALKALVGGFDFNRSKFNRVTQARRQPGSNFKPFVYSAALHDGYTAASVINDAPVVFAAPGLEAAWRPENYSGKTFGPTRLRQGLAFSRNLVSIRLLHDIGVDYAINYLKRFGFDPERLPHNLSLALGSVSLTPLELIKGFAVLANGGYRVEPYYISRIEDQNGKLIWQADPARVCRSCVQAKTASDGAPTSAPAIPTTSASSGATLQTSTSVAPPASASTAPAASASVAPAPAAAVTAAGPANGAQAGAPKEKIAPQVVSPQVAWIVDSMMRSVIREGTGRRALALKRTDLSGKTGTTNKQKDAWFSGFNDRIVATCWVGFDHAQPLGRHETGAVAALPMWMDYMRVALKGMPESELPEPPGLVTVRIDPVTGLRASADDKNAIFETFRVQDVPKLMSSEHPAAGGGSGTPATTNIPEQLF